MTKSMVDIYEKGISTAGMSKAYNLAGLRLGWITGPERLIEEVMVHRDYDTISVGMIDDHFATLALDNCNRLLKRSRDITRQNLGILSAWIETEPKLSWVQPRSGTTELIKFDLAINSYEFCIVLLQKTGVMLTPGSALGMEDYVLIGYANNSEILKEGLKRISDFLARSGNGSAIHRSLRL